MTAHHKHLLMTTGLGLALIGTLALWPVHREAVRPAPPAAVAAAPSAAFLPSLPSVPAAAPTANAGDPLADQTTALARRETAPGAALAAPDPAPPAAAVAAARAAGGYTGQLAPGRDPVATGPSVLVEGTSGVGADRRQVRVLRRPGFAWPVREEVPVAQAGVATAGAAAVQPRTIVADHLVVTLRPGRHARDLESVLKAFDGQVRRVLPVSGRVLVSFDGTDLDRLGRARGLLARAAAVASVSEDQVVQVTATRPNDPVFAQLWGLENVGQNSSRATVAIAGGATLNATPMIYAALTPPTGISAAIIDCGEGYPADFPARVNGAIALIRRSAASAGFTFAAKTSNAQAAGAVAVIITDNVAGPAWAGALGAPGAWPPVVGMTLADGDALRATLPATATLIALGSTVDADIDAPEAWDRTTGNGSVIVGVIDSGIDYTHPDLAANIWTNPDEIPGNGLDDDGNGLVDDVHGYDFYNDDGDPMDGFGHGTHCAGTIGASGNNGVGVAGVCWNVQLMALKGFSDGGLGSYSALSEGVRYATMMRQRGHNVRLTSNSWGPQDGGGADTGMEAAIREADAAGVLFVCAAGNDAKDHETTPYYPADYDIGNIIAVAATDCNDALASFSCYGAVHVDLAAPGVDIWSTYKGNYAKLAGTSMACPHVAGAAALIMMANPGLDHHAVRQALLDGVDAVPSLSGKVATGGRLNLVGALDRAGVGGAYLDAAVTWTETNGNGMLEPGEAMPLTVTLRNLGGAVATGVRLELTVADTNAAPWVEMLTGTVAVGGLAVAESRVVPGLVLRVHADAPTPLLLPVIVRAVADQGVWPVTRYTTVYTVTEVSGLVSRDGQPAAGVRVRHQGTSPATTVGTALSGADGRYRFPAISGTCVLWAEQDGWIGSATVALTVDAAAGPATGPDFDFTTARVAGQVTEGGSGRPIADASVVWTLVDNSLRGFNGSATTDVSGAYVTADLICGRPVDVRLRGFKTGAYASALPVTFHLPPAAEHNFELWQEHLVVEPASLVINAEVGEEVHTTLRLTNPGGGVVRWGSSRTGVVAPAPSETPGRLVNSLPGIQSRLPADGQWLEEDDTALAYDNDAGLLYVVKNIGAALTPDHVEIRVLDAHDGHLVRVLNLAGRLQGQSLKDLAFDGVNLWALEAVVAPDDSNNGYGQILKIEPLTGEILDVIGRPDSGYAVIGWPYGLAWGDGYLWLVLQDKRIGWPQTPILFQIDPLSGRPVHETVCEVWQGMVPGRRGAVYYGEKLWMAQGGLMDWGLYEPFWPVHRFDPATGKLLPAAIPQPYKSQTGLDIDDRGRMWSLTQWSQRMWGTVGGGSVYEPLPSMQRNKNQITVTSTGTAPWLGLDQHGGVLPPAAATLVSVSVDAALLDPGTRTATITLVTGSDRHTVPVTVNVTVPAGNRAPRLQDDAFTVQPETVTDLAVLNNDSDPDGDALQIESVESPRAGAVAIAGNVLRYRSYAGFRGRDAFHYTVSDGQARHRRRAEVVVMVDDAVALPLVNPSLEADALADGGSVTPPTGLTLRNSPWFGADWYYDNLDADYGGRWRTDVTAMNPTDAQYPGAGDGSPAPGPLPHGRNVLRLHFRGARLATDPVAVVEAGATYSLSVAASTPMDAAMIEEDQQLYLLAGPSGQETYLGKTPAMATAQGLWNRYPLECNGQAPADLVGTPLTVQVFTTRWWDFANPGPNPPQTHFDDFRLLKRVLPTDLSPEATPDQAATLAGVPLMIDVLANDRDPEGGALTLVAVMAPTAGGATIAGGQVSYQPSPGWSGLDQFAYVIRDPAGNQASGWCRVTVLANSANHPPTIVSAAWADPSPVTLPAGTTVHVVASDPDGDPLTYAWTKVSGAGTATFAAPGAADSGVTFSAAGTYVLRVTVADGKGGSISSDVSVTVNAGSGVDPRADLNHDGVVNALDLQIVIANFGQTVGAPGCDARADANADGVVNALDLQIVIANFGQTVP